MHAAYAGSDYAQGRSAVRIVIKCEAIRIGLKIKGAPFRCNEQLMEYVRSLAGKRPKHYKLKQVQVNGQSYYNSYYAKQG